MKVLKIILPLTLAATLAVGLSLPGVAAQEPEETEDVPPAWGRELPRLLRGTVVELDEGETYFVIQHGDNVTAEIAVDAGTKYYIVQAPKKLIGLLRNRAEFQNQTEAEASVIKPARPLNLGQLIRNRMVLKQQNNIEADDVKPVKPRKLKLTNAAQLRKLNGSEQVVSRPMANPEPIQVNPEDEDADAEGWGKWQRFRRFAQKATFDDIEVRDRVVVRLVPGQDKPVARQVVIFKPWPYMRVAGTITDVSSDNQTITIDPPNDGEPVTLNYNDDTIFNLKGFITVEPGQLARAVYQVEGMMAKLVRVRLPGDTEFAESSD